MSPANMRANDIANTIKVYEHALRVLREQLPAMCAAEGHVWDSVTGKLTTVCTREGVWEEADLECTPRFGSRGGHWAIKPEYADVYERTCTRCGHIQRQEPVVKRSSPFTS